MVVFVTFKLKQTASNQLSMKKFLFAISVAVLTATIPCTSIPLLPTHLQYWMFFQATKVSLCQGLVQCNEMPLLHQPKVY